MIDKQALKTTMLSLTEADMLQARSKYEAFLAAARLDQFESIEIDEHAQAKTAAELAEAFDDNIHSFADKIETLKQIDFSPKTEVMAGAVVQIGNRNLVIGVSTAEFNCQGKNYIGISDAAPIYVAMEGKIAGEPCTFNGQKIVIRAIF